MLTISDVRRFVNNSAYFARGRVYAEEGRVKILDSYAMSDGSIAYSAEVDGSWGRYEVDAVLSGQELADCRCTCPEFGRRQRMCKHVAALLIEICDAQDEAAARAKAQEAARIAAEQQEEEMRKEQSSFLDRLLFAEKIHRQDGVRLRHEAKGEVCLFPVLICEQGKAYLELKIGSSRAYVVRNLWQFGMNAANRAREIFGKELTFSHTEEELHPEDVELYYLIKDIALREDTKGARACLENEQLDAMMRLLMGREVHMRVDDKPVQPAKVVEGDGGVSGELTQQADGHLLRLEAKNAVFGDRGAYYFCPEAGEIRCVLRGQFAKLAPLLTLAARYPQGVRLEKEQLEETALRLLVPAGAALTMNKGKEILLAHTPMAMRPRFLVDMDGKGRLTCDLLCDYGAVTLSPAEDNPHIRRDVLGEDDARASALRIFPREERKGRYVFEGREEAVFEVLSERIHELAEDGEVLVAERLKRYHVQSRRAIAFGVTPNGDSLLVKADLGGLTQEELEAAYYAYRTKKKYIRLEDGAFLSGEALKQAAETAEVAKGLDLTADELAKGANVPMSRALYLDAALREREAMELKAPETVKDFVQRLNDSKTVQAEQPAGLKATLRPYQLSGYNWLCAMNDAGFGGILADDMGLGKTLQALSLLLREKEAGRPLRALVVCPASLQLNWLAEAEKFVPSLRCAAMLGTAQERKALLEKAGEDAPDVLLVSYDQLRRDAQAYHGQAFTHMLLDEAQYIKNAASQSAKACKAVNARCRFAMTGTPIENRLSELWSIFDFFLPGYLLTYKKFKERFEAPIVQDGDEEARDNLRMLVSPFILRRMKADVLSDLPEKVETVLRSEMTPRQRMLYLANEAQLTGELDTDGGLTQNRMKILAGITRLRQLCCDPTMCLEGYADGSGKLEQCVDVVQSAVQAGHRILLFSQFTSMLDILKKRLEDEGLSTYLLIGGTDKEERMEMAESFNDGGADVFLISLKAGGTGLNLTGADMVIHYDPWWNLAAQNQATDRAYRIGQTKNVQVYKLIASSTIEERILKLQEAKAELGDGVLEGTDGLAALDEDTLRRLLG